MSRVKRATPILVLSTILSFYTILSPNAIAWENQLTHPAITQKAVERSTLNDFLKNQLGLSAGLETQLELTSQFQNNINRRVAQETDFSWNETRLSVKQWLRDGSKLEDVPNPRARHHFYDPIRNTGLNNSDANPELLSALWLGSKWFYPDYWGFDARGGSAVKRSLGCADDWGVDWESEPEYLTNKYNWPVSRNLFYDALTTEQKLDREKYMGTMFVMLGHICHLLEDVGVPAHTRNDFVWGHMVASFYKNITGAKKPWYKGGHPFEAWMETQIADNGDEIPGIYLNRLMDSPPAFATFKAYWDTNVCVESGIPQWQGDSPGWPNTGFGNPPPEKSWGLAECTNYQFLSYSTMFKSSGLQSFPHPAKTHTRVDWYPTGPEGSRQYYRIGYEVPHLARVTYTTFHAYLIPIYTVETTTTEEERVYEDYAKRTISRTIDYTTGLLNYFFRGRLSVDANCSCSECSPIELYITNQSVNTPVNQTLKGGSFELYWDDNIGNRTQVSGLTVYDSNDPNRTVLWGASTTLPKGNSVRAVFNKPSSSNIIEYVLVYRGSISANPNDPDPDDPNAIAVCTFEPPGPPQPHITSITPEMGCPGSILLIEGRGFSKTPSHNTVLFDDVNTGHPNVYGTVTEADSNGRWLKVELPYFDAESVDYYWADTTVTTDGNTSDPYAFMLTNYIWLTITIWDAGESVDDDFDVWVNGEYWFTSYQAPPEDPTVTEVGFWYEDVYDFVDVYLYESYGISGGTLRITIEPYVDRVTAYRWNDSTQSQEFLYDNYYSGTFTDYFGSDVLVNPDDGVEMDVYTILTYTGSMALTKMAPITIPKEKSTVVSTGRILERRGQFDPTRVAENKRRFDIPKKRVGKITGHQRTRNKVKSRTNNP